jgi:hypothetical protein
MQEEIYFDLTLDEIALMLHMFLKKSKTQYITINFHIEKYTKLQEEDKYTLIIIASNSRMSKYELLTVYKKICDANDIRFIKGDKK